MFLGGLGERDEDKIFFVVRKLFTGPKTSVKTAIFCQLHHEKGASFREAPVCKQALYTS
jgi:hypothetical protein